MFCNKYIYLALHVVNVYLIILLAYPSGVNHALWYAGSAGGVHDEQRMIERLLFKLQFWRATFRSAELNKVCQRNSTHITAASHVFKQTQPFQRQCPVSRRSAKLAGGPANIYKETFTDCWSTSYYYKRKFFLMRSTHYQSNESTALTSNLLLNADYRRGSKAFSSVCDSVRLSPHDKTKTAETKIKSPNLTQV